MHVFSALTATALHQDARVKQAKQLLLAALSEYSQKITQIKPAHPDLVAPYDEIIATFNQYRGGKLWYPYIGSGLGNGALVELLDGSIKYDCICGIGPHFWGHSHPALVEAAINAALSDTIMQGNLQQNLESVQFSKLLIDASGMDHCFLTTSGAMANENALKIAFQSKFPATRILAFEKCFLGRSLVESQVTDKPAFREGLPLNYPVDYLPFYDESQPAESIANTVKALKKHLSRYPRQHAVIIFELIQGEGGFYAGNTLFFQTIMQIAHEHNVAIFVDEIQTFGRTSRLFAYQHYGVDDYVDIVSAGKLSQVCATLFRKNFKPQAGLLSQTFTASTSALYAGKVLVEGLLQQGYFGPDGHNERLHHYFAGKLQAIANRHPDLIHGPFGVGCMMAFTPYDGDIHRATKMAHRLYEEGVIAFIAGSFPTRIRFLLPAGAITETDLAIIAQIIEKVLVEGDVSCI